MNRNQLDNILTRARSPSSCSIRTISGSTICSRPFRRRDCRSDGWTSRATGTFFEAIAAMRPERRADRRRRGRRCRHPVHVRHQRAAQGGRARIFANTSAISIPPRKGSAYGADDRVYDFRSFNWASAQLLGALVPVNRGATLVMAEKFSASRYFQHVRDHRVTVAAGNPTTINILLNTDEAAQRAQPADAALSSPRARRR